MERWATFDCYGTLIDWNDGVRAELERVFGDDRADELLERYHEIEPELQQDSTRSYREVLTESMRRLGAPAGEVHSLAESLPSWRSFTDAHGALTDLRARGWKLGVLSNTDTDYIAASLVQIGVPFDEVVVAQEIGSYKPAHRHWEEFFARTHAAHEGHVHVGASIFHDVVPCEELGLRCVWINRLGEAAGEHTPTATLTDLFSLPGVLDELVPA